MLASTLGGAYSLIILVNLPRVLGVLIQLAAAIIIVLCAFRFYRVKSLAVTVGVFFFSNFVLLGVITGVHFILKPDGVTVKNSVVYFDIGAPQLLFSALAAYLISCLAVRIYNRRVSRGEVYTLVIENNSKAVTLFALADSGNLLREPFSDSPVIVADEGRAASLFENEPFRLIPASTVSGSDYLKAFKPDRIIIKNSKGSEVVENAYVALSQSLENGNYGAVLNPSILSV